MLQNLNSRYSYSETHMLQGKVILKNGKQGYIEFDVEVRILE